MLRALPDLPPGVIGFEGVGEVHADDYREVLRPAVESAAASGAVRLVYVLGPEFHGYSAAAGWEDVRMGLGHLSAFERTAVVTDVEWIEHLVNGFGWMVPGELRRFRLADLDAAVRWAAAEEADDATPDAAVAGEGSTEAPSSVGEPAAASDQPGPGEGSTDGRTQEAGAPVPDPTVETPVASGGVEPQRVEPQVPVATGDDQPIAATPATAPAAAAPSVPAQWAPDPTGRHHHRWWDGVQWTGHVADSGVSSFDPI